MYSHLFQDFKNMYPDLVILSRNSYVVNEEKNICYAINEDFEKYFYDYGHHTIAGAKFFAGRIDKIGWLNPLLQKIKDKRMPE